MAIIKQYHKDTDTTYVYESVSYWDEEKKQSRSKRRVIGKLDPVTGEIIPTGRRGRKGKEDKKIQDTSISSSETAPLDDQIRELRMEISARDARIAGLEKENRKLREAMAQLGKYASQCVDLCTGFNGEGR